MFILFVCIHIQYACVCLEILFSIASFWPVASVWLWDTCSEISGLWMCQERECCFFHTRAVTIYSYDRQMTSSRAAFTDVHICLLSAPMIYLNGPISTAVSTCALRTCSVFSAPTDLNRASHCVTGLCSAATELCRRFRIYLSWLLTPREKQEHVWAGCSGSFNTSRSVKILWCLLRGPVLCQGT